MAWYAANFVFNNIPSESLGLRITSDGPESSTNASSDVQLVTEKIFRRPRNFLMGVEQGPVLQFPASFRSEKKIDAIMASQIANKLFGQMGYKKLQIIQPDTDQYYWNCYLSNAKIQRNGGEIVGWDCDIICDSPWAYSFPKTYPYNYTPPVSNVSVLFNNRSGNNDYTYPTVIFTMANTGGGFTITNSTDNNRVFQFFSMSANEVVTVDNDLQIITSSTGLLRLSNFNLNFFRLLSGRNDLLVSGNISQLKIIYGDAQKIGG